MDPCSPGDIRRRAADMCDRIGKARAVHMQFETSTARNITDCRDFIWPPGETIFGGIGDADRRRLHLMDIGADGGEAGMDGIRRDLGAVTGQQHQLCPAGEESGCAAFVDLDMRFLVAQDSLPWLDEGGERDAVCGRARGQPKHRYPCFEQVGKRGVEPLRQRVAIISSIDMVGGGNCVQHVRMDGCRIVREEARGGGGRGHHNSIASSTRLASTRLTGWVNPVILPVSLIVVRIKPTQVRVGRCMRILFLGLWAILASAAMVPTANAQQTSEQVYKAVASRAGPPTLVARYGADDLRIGQLRVPPGPGPFPVAVLIHGGCWTASYDTLAGQAAMAEALTARGIATWNIEYRRLGDAGAGWPGTFDDISAGIDYLTELAHDYPLDLSRVTIVGHSSGAHLALWGASRTRLGPAFVPKVNPVSVVQIDGPAALAPFIGIDADVCGQPVIVPLMGGTPAQRPDAYALASPAEHLPLGLRQLLVQGAFTPFMAPYAEATRASGDPVEVLQAGEDHFDVVTPGTANGDRVIDFIATRAFAH